MASEGGDCIKPKHAGEISQKESAAGILPSHGISLDVPGVAEDGRPPMIKHLSAPSYQSPLRHHRRTPSQHREVKETLDAHSEYTNSQDDGKYQHRINQYIIGEEIGRGSFGAVHLAIDQYGHEYAIKEFSKSRLRKRAQSNILRRPHHAKRPGHLAAGLDFNAPLHRHSGSNLHEGEDDNNPLYLIKEEIAIMKKLNHPNLVTLIEVLDDPEEDSLYMVLEMCKKGVVMKVGLDEKATPYDAECCRCWFRDLILGIEYLHAQGVVHRDIKPDNLLLTEDDVLKIVDFGVSEMFEKQSEMMTAKSAGSPAFLPPELCVARHGDISGRAADIWSMGVSLYCLRLGKIPFERPGVLELYEAIKRDHVDVPAEIEPEFGDLMQRILEKDPKRRITMDVLREHPWVTKNGEDPLLSKKENIADLVEPPTETEMKHAITSNMRNLIVVMRAVKRFKKLLAKRRPELMSEILGKDVRIVQPPKTLLEPESHGLRKTRSNDLEDRRPVQGALASEGVHGTVHSSNGAEASHIVSPVNRMDSAVIADPANSQPVKMRSAEHDRQNQGESQTPSTSNEAEISENHRHHGSHSHDLMDDIPPFLGIGLGSDDEESPPAEDRLAESPTAAEFNIYDTAYQLEVERIRKIQGRSATVYLTRRVDSKKEYKADENMIEAPKAEEVQGQPHAGWKAVLDTARERDSDVPAVDAATTKSRVSKTLSDLATQAGANAKSIGLEAITKGQEWSTRSGSGLSSAMRTIVNDTKEKLEDASKEQQVSGKMKYASI